MTKHPSAGKPIKITAGPFKDKYFMVVDYLVNQYQGKELKKIDLAHPELLIQFKRTHKEEQFEADKIVFGQLYPTMSFECVHDSELMVLSKSDERRLKIVGGKDGAIEPSTEDSSTTEPGESDIDGRSVPSGEAPTELRAVEDIQPEPSGPTGGDSAGAEQEHPLPSQQKTGTRKPAKGSKSK